MNDDVDVPGKLIICYLPPRASDPSLEMPSLIIYNAPVLASARRRVHGAYSQADS
jgi:hypothetical protein